MIRKHFGTGIVILLPVTLTIGIVLFVVNFLTKPFMGPVGEIIGSFRFLNQGFLFFNQQELVHFVSQIIILILLVVFTVFLGVVGRWFLVRSLIRLGETILHRIPFVNKVYKTTQEVIQTIFASQSQSFKQVVLVPYPNEYTKCIGLVTRTAPKECQDEEGEEMISVFLPTTPNPTSGYLLMFPKSKVHYLNMKVEDGIKFIISCGVIHPAEAGGGEHLLNKDPS